MIDPIKFMPLFNISNKSNYQKFLYSPLKGTSLKISKVNS